MDATEAFQKTRRIRRKKEIDAVFRSVDFPPLKSGVFVLHLKTNGLGCSRLGLAVSRRVSKKAVERNYIKRLIRESFRKYAQFNLDVIVVSKPAANTVSKTRLNRFLLTGWRLAEQAEMRNNQRA